VHQVIAALGQQHTGTDMAGAREAGIATPAGAAVIASSYPTAPLDRLDGAGKRALARAYWEAGRANEKDIAPHHLLLGLIANDEVWVHRFLTELGAEPVAIVSCIETAWPARQAPRLAAFRGGHTHRGIRPSVNRWPQNATARSFGRSTFCSRSLAPRGSRRPALDSVGATTKRIREILDRMNG